MLRKTLSALYRPIQRTHMRSSSSSFEHKVGIGETVADDAERFFEPPSNDGDFDDDEHKKDIVVPKHTLLDCVPGDEDSSRRRRTRTDDFVDENVDVDAELYATKVRNDALEQSHRVLVRNENALLVEARHYESALFKKDRVIEGLKTRLLCAEEASSSKRRAREEDERARKMVERKTKATMKETLRLLEKTTSALELTRKENEVLGLKLEKSHQPKTGKKEKKKEKKKRTTTTTASRGRTPLPETPPFAKKFWSYRNEEKRGLHEEERTHPLRFFVNDVEEEEEDDFYSDDFYSDDDDDNEEDTTTTSSSSEDEDEDEDENRRRAAADDTSYSSIDELLDRSVVLNSRLEALEQRARHLATASSKPPDASAKQTE